MMKRGFYTGLILLATAVLFSSCSKKHTVVQPEPQQQEDVQAEPAVSGVEVVEPISPEEVEVAGVPREQIDVGTQPPAVVEEEKIQKDFKDIHFDYDKYDIRPEDQATLARLADWMIKNPYSKVTIEGHCDERGTDEYNLALGERRARAAKNYLLASGVDKDRIATITYGEERPLDPGHNEEAWRKNRRGHFVIIE